MTDKQAVERSSKIQKFYENDFEDFMNAKLEYWANKDNPDYEPPAKYAEYLKKIQDVDARDIILDGELVRLPLNESQRHYGLYVTKDMELNKGAQIHREWNYQFTIQTPENKYEDAPEFEAFVNKWMNKGLTEDEALYRAHAYSLMGLLDYGNQRAIEIADLPYGDKKQHGFHLVDNDVLKEAVLETLDSITNEEVWGLKFNIFGNGQHTSLNTEGIPGISFQKLLNNFALLQEKMPPLNKEYEDLVFNGDINITDNMDQLYKNFIFDNIKAYFKFRAEELNSINNENTDHEMLKEQVNLIKTLIDNFDKNIKKSKDQ